MALEAQYLSSPDTINYLAPAALVSGQVLQMPDGRAGVVPGAGAGFGSGDVATAMITGMFRLAKTASIVILAGQEVWWDESENKAIHSSVGGDFPIGVAIATSAAATTTVDVDLNKRVQPAIALGQGGWTTLETDGGSDIGLGLTYMAGRVKAQFDTATEAATASLLSDHSIAIDNKPILEAVLNIIGNGDDAALDINIGLVNAGHADNADTITESVFIHIDGNDTDIFAESDDGSVEVNATDTNVDYTEGTAFFLQIDASDLADVRIYINGVAVLVGSETFVLTSASGPMKALFHMEKSSNDTLAIVHVDMMHVRTGLNT